MTRGDGQRDTARSLSVGKEDIGELSVHLPITLSQFLKAARLVDTGGEAKTLIQAGSVRVNGEVETRRARQLCRGDVVEVAGEKVRVGQEFA